MFIPVFKIGAAFGRIVGEALHLYFPMGIRYGGRISQIIPGNNLLKMAKKCEKLVFIYFVSMHEIEINSDCSFQVDTLLLERQHFQVL